MPGDDGLRAEFRGHDFSTIAEDADLGTEQHFRGGAAEGDEQARLEREQLSDEPRLARADVARVRFLVQTAFAARLPFKMLHCVGEVDFSAVDTRFGERAVEELSGGSDEGMTLAVFGVAGLFADDDDVGIGRAFAEGGLRRAFVKRARGAGGGGAQRGEIARDRRLGGMPVARQVLVGFTSGDHAFDAGGSFADERGDELRLRKILPIALRHLGLHRAYFHAGWVENVRVIFLPERLHIITRGRFRAREADGEMDRLPIPMHAPIRRENRPPHTRSGR